MVAYFTDFDDVSVKVNELVHRQKDWLNVSISQRIEYLNDGILNCLSIAKPWVNACCKSKGIDPESSLGGEEWIIGPISIVRQLRLLKETLSHGGLLKPPRIYQRNNGQNVAQVMPSNLFDRLLWLGYRGEVWLQPNQPITQGRIYRQKTSSGVCLVLGAGNISSIGPLDAIYKLFAENQVVILKMNPVNDYLGEFIEYIFQPLIRDGFMRLVYGGVELGEYLSSHPHIHSIHITGSHHTHDRIVWGEDPHKTQPVNNKLITSELGCVTPILIVPGSWTKGDLHFQGRHIASSIAHNASFNCAATQLIITAKGWTQREEFLNILRLELAKVPPRKAYYPGALVRYQQFIDRYGGETFSNESDNQIIPWTLIPNLNEETDDYILREEAFCGILGELVLDTDNPATFLQKAVDFSNQKIWGNLSCAIFIHPQTQQQYTQELDQAIAALEYGSIGINLWSAMMYYLGSTPWGAFPGNSLDNIQSGRGIVHNTYMFDHPQKSVVYAPFQIFPTPPWFAGHRNLLELSKHLIKFESQPNWIDLIKVSIAALRG